MSVYHFPLCGLALLAPLRRRLFVILTPTVRGHAASLLWSASFMYTPKLNNVSDRAVLLEAMRDNSFAILFGPLGATDTPPAHFATHLPLVVKDEGEHGLIEGHFATANQHWQALAGRETLVVFSGPHSYVSPTLYTEALSVPTWNYIAIHAYGTLSLVEDQPGKEALLTGLISANEPGLSRQLAQFA